MKAFCHITDENQTEFAGPFCSVISPWSFYSICHCRPMSSDSSPPSNWSKFNPNLDFNKMTFVWSFAFFMPPPKTHTRTVNIKSRSWGQKSQICIKISNKQKLIWFPQIKMKFLIAIICGLLLAQQISAYPVWIKCNCKEIYIKKMQKPTTKMSNRIEMAAMHIPIFGKIIPVRCWFWGANLRGKFWGAKKKNFSRNQIFWPKKIS